MLVAGGGWKCEAACTADEILPEFMKPRLDSSPNITTSISIIRFAVESLCSGT